MWIEVPFCNTLVTVVVSLRFNACDILCCVDSISGSKSLLTLMNCHTCTALVIAIAVVPRNKSSKKAHSEHMPEISFTHHLVNNSDTILVM